MERVILLADDELLFRKGLNTLLNISFGENDIDEVASCGELMSFLKDKHYTHLITEAVLTDGSTSSVLPSIRERFPELQIMVLTNLQEDVIKAPLLAFGINQFLSKKAGERVTIRTIEKFLKNEIPVGRLKRTGKTDKILNLTPREFEVYSLMLEEKSTSEIAKELNIKWTTVSTYKHNMYEKNKVKNWKELKELSSFHSKVKRKSDSE